MRGFFTAFRMTACFGEEPSCGRNESKGKSHVVLGWERFDRFGLVETLGVLRLRLRMTPPSEEGDKGKDKGNGNGSSNGKDNGKGNGSSNGNDNGNSNCNSNDNDNDQCRFFAPLRMERQKSRGKCNGKRKSKSNSNDNYKCGDSSLRSE